MQIDEKSIYNDERWKAIQNERNNLLKIQTLKKLGEDYPEERLVTNQSIGVLFHFNLNDPESSLEYFYKMIADDYVNPYANLMIAKSWDRLGCSKLAEKYYKKSALCNQSYHIELCAFYTRGLKHQEALDALKLAGKITVVPAGGKKSYKQDLLFESFIYHLLEQNEVAMTCFTSSAIEISMIHEELNKFKFNEVDVTNFIDFVTSKM